MLIVIEKKKNTNSWDYPGEPMLFSDPFQKPSEPGQLVVTNNSGKTPAELSVIVPYAVIEYTGPLPALNRRTKVTMGELVTLMGEKAYLKVFRAAYSNGTLLGNNKALYFLESRRYAVGESIEITDQAIGNELDYFIENNFITLADKARIIQGIEV